MSSFPTPPYNPNIPIVTSAGGTTVAYKDPNSPESLMKKVTLLNAQTAVDRKFDSTTPTHEGFCSFCPTELRGFSSPTIPFVFILFILLLVFLLVPKFVPSRYRSFVFILLFLLFSVSFYSFYFY